MSLVSKVLGLAMLITVPMTVKGVHNFVTKDPIAHTPSEAEKRIIVDAFSAISYGSLAYSSWRYRAQLRQDLRGYYQNLFQSDRKEAA